MQQHQAQTDPAPQQLQQHDGHQQHEQAAVPGWQSYSSVFTAAKAGMGGVDQQKVKQVVYEMSKNSAHYAQEQRKQAQTDARIARLKAQAAAISPAQLAGHQKSCDAKIALLEAGRELGKTWLHVDMDAFYAGVEELDQPALKDKPMAVGGMGMICTANYVARKFGVRSAMPGFIAKKLCPQLVFVKPDFSKYTAASAEAFAVFRCYDPRVAGASLDEAYLDVTQHCAAHGMSGEQVAAELRARVVEATRGLTCSVGVAPNMMLAKIASDRNKPNGQCVVGPTREEVLQFISDLPIRKIPGIGKVTEQTLQALGVSSCSDLIRQAALLIALLSDISSSSLIQAGLGLGATEHHAKAGGEGSSEPGRKGISCERTFAAMSSAAEMEAMAESLVNHLAADMASEGIKAKTLTLKLKTTAFEVRTRAVTLPGYVCSAVAMLPPILRLLRAELPVEIRLMGVRGSNLVRAPQRLDQLASEGRKLNALERMVLQGRQQQQQEQQGPEQEQEKGQGLEILQQQQMAEGGEAHQLSNWQDEEYEGSEHGEDDGGVHADGDALGSQGAARLLLLQPSPLSVPTQEELQARYEQQCWQQEHHEQEEQEVCAQAGLVDAADQDGWGGQQHQQHMQVHGAAAGFQQLEQQSQDHQHHQQQQEEGWAGWDAQQPWGGSTEAEGAESAGLQASKRRRRSFKHPAPHAQHAADAAGTAKPLTAAAVHSLQHWQQHQHQPTQQQQQQSPRGADGEQLHQQPCWQTASAIQLQEPVLQVQQQRQQQQDHLQPGQDQQWLQQQDAVHVQPQAQNPAGQDSAHAGNPAHVAAATGRPQGSRHDAGGAPSSSGRSTGRPWTCLACTFSNEHKWLRCAVCETPKGDTQPPPSLLTLPGGGCRPTAAAGTARPGGGRGGGGRAGAGSSSKQLTLEHLGLHKRSRR